MMKLNFCVIDVYFQLKSCSSHACLRTFSDERSGFFAQGEESLISIVLAPIHSPLSTLTLNYTLYTLNFKQYTALGERH